MELGHFRNLSGFGVIHGDLGGVGMIHAYLGKNGGIPETGFNLGKICGTQADLGEPQKPGLIWG